MQRTCQSFSASSWICSLLFRRDVCWSIGRRSRAIVGMYKIASAFTSLPGLLIDSCTSNPTTLFLYAVVMTCNGHSTCCFRWWVMVSPPARFFFYITIITLWHISPYRSFQTVWYICERYFTIGQLVIKISLAIRSIQIRISLDNHLGKPNAFSAESKIPTPTITLLTHEQEKTRLYFSRTLHSKTDRSRFSWKASLFYLNPPHLAVHQFSACTKPPTRNNSKVNETRLPNLGYLG